MSIPATVAAAFRVLRALRARNAQAASDVATARGKKRIAKLIAVASDPCAKAIAAWGGTAQGRVAVRRALCRFAELPEGQVAVLDLVLEPGGWKLDDARIVPSDEYEDFGDIDESGANTLG
jgi:hypothetical protein